MFVYDRVIAKQVYYYADGVDRDFDTWYEVCCVVSVSVYLFLTFRFYNQYHKIIFHLSSNAYTIRYQWVRNFLIAFVVYLVLFSGFSLYSALIRELDYKEFWWYYLLFAITVYYIAINGYSNAIANKVPFRLVANHRKIKLELGYESKKKELVIEDIEHLELTVSETTDTEIINWKNTIQNALVQQKLYEDPELSLPDLAKKLQTNPSVLSRAINKGFGQNFNDLINHYRIDAVVSLLKTGEQKRQTLLGIAYDCGFNSKATFNRAFKKRFQMSPKEWLEKEPGS
jgi:AraC-like DNA-binding protein